ncbi:MAG: transcriptional regulator, PucR family [Conexibacter sp.]|nr:transcriptional regulator, PucR family [Conexibacter sp.]
MDLTVGDLLDARELDLRLLTAQDSGRARPVRGAHGIEVANPTRWVPPGWLMLTNGLRVRGSAKEQRRLVAELDAGGQAALGWAVGLVLQRVPRAILDEAQRRDFPVLLVPLETAFHEIISLVGGARINDDVLFMRRLLAMEDYLIDALRLAEPHRNVLIRLASLLDVDVALFDADGEPVEVVGSARLPEMREAMRAIEGGTWPAHDEIVIVPVDRGPDTPDHLLIAAARRSSHEPRLMRPVARRASQILGLLTSSERNREEADRARGAELLRQALQGVDGEEARALDGEARMLDIDWSAPAHVVAWETGGASHTRARVAPLAKVLSEAGLPHLIAAGDQPVALVQGEVGVLLAALRHAASGGAARAGVGRPVTSLREARTSLHDARIALAQTRADGMADAPVVRFDELDPVAWLVAMAADAAGRRRLRAFLDPLREQPELVVTLRAWLGTSCNVTEAAAVLHLHRNSMNYRLARIQELLGTPLKSPRTLANLQAALMAENLDTTP